MARRLESREGGSRKNVVKDIPSDVHETGASHQRGSLVAEPHWWGDFPEDQRWYGVFQGGGARGVAYPGTLCALAKQNHWFRSVAGSSAGALTAALVAAGFHPEEMATMTADLLGTVRPATLLDRAVHALKWTRALTRFDSSALESALEEHLRDGFIRHGGDQRSPVTFSSLKEKTKIGLYVVVLDATTGRPVPFSAELTPDLSISPAVAASCSIPVVFEPRYMEVDARSAGWADWPDLRRLVDGGAWANFPAFVFQDKAFRSFFSLEPMPDEPKVLGFVLGKEGSVFSARPKRFADPRRPDGSRLNPLWLRRLTARVTMPKDDQNDEGGRILFNLIRWPVVSAWKLVRFLITIGLLAAPFGLIGWLAWLVWGSIIDSDTSLLLRVSGGLLQVINLFALGAYVALLRAGVALLRDGRDTFRSIVGLATVPPIWVGGVAGSTVIFVPAPRLTTTSFSVDSEIISSAMRAAEDECNAQIDGIVNNETLLSRNRRGWEKAAKDPRFDGHEEDWADLLRDHVVEPRQRLRRHRKSRRNAELGCKSDSSLSRETGRS